MAIHVKRALSDEGSYALLSNYESVDTAIVYVHGFLGDAETTWERLQYFVDRLDGVPFQKADLFFYDYQAEENFVHIAAQKLRAFLNQVFPSPPEQLLNINFGDLDWRLQSDDTQVIALREYHSYSKLILVGHSLGAVVIRRLVADEALAVCDDKKLQFQNAPSLLDAEVVLMAPAHIGFQPSGRTALVYLIPFSSVALRLTAVFRAFTDLQPNCQVLAQLRRETERMAMTFPTSRALFPRILWGDHENVVAVGRFDSDPPELVSYATGKDHVTVCKLDSTYLVPAEIVLREASRGA